MDNYITRGLLDCSNKSSEIVIEQLLSNVSETILKKINFLFDLKVYCQSPIEEIMFAALVMKSIDFEKDHVYYKICPIPQYQTEVDNYVSDFSVELLNYLTGKPITSVLVECDGHNYHEVTKQQVTKRNERDLNLKKAGYDILHFSGSQIYNEPMKCAEDIFEYLVSKTKGES